MNKLGIGIVNNQSEQPLKQKPSGALPPSMELDLDSLLRSHGADSDDEASLSSPSHHRTLDEILNASSSSSPSPSPPVSPTPSKREQTSIERPPEALEGSASSAFESASWRTTRSKELSSLGLRSYSSTGATLPPLPPLLGGVRPSPKPGAALAAAAAASRSVFTPHAAAIKSRWASTGSLQGTLQNQELRDDRTEVSAGSEGLDGSDLSEAIGSEAKREAVGDVRGESVSSVSRSSSSFEAEAVHEVLSGEERLETNGSFSSPKETEISELPEHGDELLDTNFGIQTLAVDSEDASQVDESLPLGHVAGFVVEHSVEGIHEVKLEEPGPQTCELDEETSQDEETKANEEEAKANEEESKIVDEIDKLVEKRFSQLEHSKKVEKKSCTSMKPLEWAEELEKKQSSSGLHWEEGAAAQPMRLEGIRRGPPAVGYLQIDLDNAVTRTISSQALKREHGSSQVVAVHINFIAVGMSKGSVLVFPSKYSIHCADNMDSKMLTFGAHGEKSQTSVTSMCFNQPGDLLLVGYADGHLTVWDVQKATVAKMITGEHTAAAVHALFLGQDSQVTRQFKAVTGDSKGLVLLHTFSVVPLLNRFSIKTQCLLDGQKTGTVLSACPIVVDDFNGTGYTSSQVNLPVSSSALGSMVGGVVGGVVGGESGWKLFNEGSSLAEEGVVIFVTHQNALVVRLSPNVEVYEKFNKPDGVREGSMPYTAWKCTTYLHGASDKASWLVIAWDRRVQIAKLVKSEMKKYKEWNLDSAAIGVSWLDDQMLVVLTLKGQLCLYAKDGTEINRTSFAVDGSGMDDIITYHAHFTNTFGNPEKAYHNSVAVRGASIYILGPMHLLVSRLLPWKERIQVLQRAGDWMGALDMAMSLYDGQAHGVIDLPRSLDAIREVIMPYLVELLFSYVDEVFSYIAVAFCNQTGKSGQVEGPTVTGSSRSSDIEEQYARVGGVAVEFCVHIKRTDILFDSIFTKFVAVQHGGTFLEILEPYILRDMLGCLPPEIMQALVEHYSGKGWLQRVEQCVLHMDISSLDFNQVVKLCRENGLYGALIYLFNSGLDDFRTPLEELLVVVQSGQRSDVAALGYRMLVYLKYCFQGLAFPPGRGTLSPACSLSIKKELLQFLLEDSKPSTSQMSRSFRSSCGSCPNLCHLLWLDTEATLEVLRCAFQEVETERPDNSFHDVATPDMEQENDGHAESLYHQNLMVQSATDMLIFILDLESDTIRSVRMDDYSEVWPSTKDLAYLLEFIAFLVVCMHATVSERVLKHILEYMTSHDLPPCGPSHKIESSRKEKQVLALLKVVPQTDWSYSYVLHLCMEAQFHQACGFLYKIRGQYIAALDSYMKDFQEPVHAFAFIDKMMLELQDTQASSFQSAVLTRIPELVKLSRECTFFLFLDHFSKESQHILLQLHSHPESLFLFLKTAIDAHLSGSLSFAVLETSHASNVSSGKSDSCNELEAYLERLSNFPKLLHHNSFDITDEMAELYLELLCQYERNSVLKFLETFENYRVEHCLRLCQEYGITDAAAFLLERVGDVGSALGLLMSGLKEKFDILVAAVEDISHNMSSSNLPEVEQVDDIFKTSEVTAMHDVLHACIGLCQRNTQRLDPQESESLWFRLLDSFSEPMRRLYGGKEFTEAKSHDNQLSAISGVKLDEESLSIWRFNKFDKHAVVLRRVFAQFIGEIIEGMAGYVALPVIMAKLLSDNGNQEFGDFKFTILRMLGTYGYERRILGTAKSLIEDDAFYTMNLLKKGASHAYAPQNFMCCICGCSLTKEYSTSGIRVFSCGHSTHLHCEMDGNEPLGRGSSAGCPICLPKKNPHARSKSILDENGLVRNGTSSQTVQGIASIQHPHEPDVLEKPYGFQPISRFEILTNLQKAQRSLKTDTLPQLRLSPPAIYHDKVQKGGGLLIGEARNTPVTSEKPNKRWLLREPKSKGSRSHFPLKSSIFGPEKNSPEKNKVW